MEQRLARRSRAALFIGLVGAAAACGGRDVGPGPSDASQADADAATKSDAPEQCVPAAGDCTDPSQCCDELECVDGQCGYVTFYGGPPIQNDE